MSEKRKPSSDASQDLSTLDEFAVTAMVDLTFAREFVARWMMERGYATGHGDTLADLLVELEGQAAEGRKI